MKLIKHKVENSFSLLLSKQSITFSKKHELEIQRPILDIKLNGKTTQARSVIGVGTLQNLICSSIYTAYYHYD